MPFRVFKWLFLAVRFWCFKHQVLTEGGQGRLDEGQRTNAVRSKPPGGPQVELAAGEGAGQGLQDLCCRQPCAGGCGPRRAAQRAPGACCPEAAPGSTRGGSGPPRPPSRPAEGRRCCGRLSRRRRPREGRGARARLSARPHPRRAPGLVPRLGGGPEPSGGPGGAGAGSAGRRAPAAAAAERGLRGARARCGARPRGAGWRAGAGAGAGAGPEAPPPPPGRGAPPAAKGAVPRSRCRRARRRCRSPEDPERRLRSAWMLARSRLHALPRTTAYFVASVPPIFPSCDVAVHTFHLTKIAKGRQYRCGIRVQFMLAFALALIPAPDMTMTCVHSGLYLYKDERCCGFVQLGHNDRGTCSTKYRFLLRAIYEALQNYKCSENI